MKERIARLKLRITSTSRDQRIKFLIVILLFVVPSLAYIAKSIEPKNTGVEYESSKYLYVVNVFKPNDRDNKIEIQFSDAVDPHLLEHNITISPDVPGSIEKSWGENRYTFVASEKFKRDTFYSLTILKGLTSENRKPLLNDYNKTFVIEETNKGLSVDNISARVLSFSENDPMKVDVNSPKVTIYSTDVAALLNNLVYKKAEKDPDTSSYEQFINSQIDTSLMKLVKTLDTEGDFEVSLKLKAGIYYAETDNQSGSFIVVNKYGVLLRQDDEKLIMAAFDLASGRKFSEKAEVAFYNLGDAPTQVALTEFTELSDNFPIEYPRRFDVAIVTINGDRIFVPLRLPQAFSDIKVYSDLDKDYNIFLYTDRPIYKPGDTVFFRGIVRQDSDSLYELPAEGTPIYISTSSYSEGTSEAGKNISQTVKLSSTGVYNGFFKIPEDSRGASWSLTASRQSSDSDTYYPSGYASFNVSEYIKPEFGITVKPLKDSYLSNEPAKFEIEGKYFSGSPMANQEVEYQAYTDSYYVTEKAVYSKNFNLNAQGGMCGGGGTFDGYYGEPLGKSNKVKLDSNGKAIVEAPLDSKAALSQQLTLIASKTDKFKNNIEGAGKLIRYAGDFNIFYIPSSTTYEAGENLVAPFYAEDQNGGKVKNKDFQYKLIYNNYGQDAEKIFFSGSTKTDDDGKGIVAFQTQEKFTDQGYLELITEGRDQFGNKIEGRKSIYVTKKSQKTGTINYWNRASQTYLNISSSKNSFIVNDTITLSVDSPSEIDALLTLERGRIYKPRIIHLEKGNNKVSIPVDSELSPSITPVFSFFANGKYYTEGLALNIPAMHKLLDVSLFTDKKEYKKNENAALTIRTRDYYGNNVPAELSLGVVDKAIYALRKSATPAIHSEFYYFRDRRTNATSSLTWVGLYGGGGGGGGGDGGTPSNKLVDTLYWNPNVTTDASGETTLSIPLGNTETTWKALSIGTTADSKVGQGEIEFLVK